ncbi:MAG: type II toxin-antitoxin system PemK/MazF family toxin [bacterium]|nr:type II toxin-antitoxin system PemK/MazF family toxin [bacterium]
MEKDFDRWNGFKRNLDGRINAPNFHERDIWWCSIGVNVGREQQSQTSDFSRPVLVLKRFNASTFWGVPLTTKVKEDGFRFRFLIDGIENDALILHMRSFDRRRLVRKIGMLSIGEFESVREIAATVLKNEIPLTGEISEAEAKV